MTRLDGTQLLLGLQPIIITTEFDPGSRTTTSGTDGGNAGGVVPAAGFYGVYSILPDLKVGASLNSYIGGSLDYGNDWVGRYYTTKAEILTFNLTPLSLIASSPGCRSAPVSRCSGRGSNPRRGSTTPSTSAPTGG